MHCKYHSFNVFYLFLLAAEVITWPENGKRRRTYKKASANIGHWEMDTVVSGKESRARLLVLSERASRKEIIIKMPDGTTQNVVLALDFLKKEIKAAETRLNNYPREILRFKSADIVFNEWRQSVI